MAGPSLPPCPQGPGHVHPHLTHEDQLPQHQADRHRVTQVSPPRPPLCGWDSFPRPPPPPALGSPCQAALVRTEGRGEPSSPACAAGQGAPRDQDLRSPTTAEKSQEARRRCLQAVVHTSLSHYTLMVAPLAEEETEAQSQERPAQVLHLSPTA